MACALAAMTALASPVADAQPARGKLRVIRDAETEQLLRDYLTPILKVAGLARQNIRVVIINDRAFNAFVMDGRHIFINTGALVDAKTPNEVIGVLAHETGHIAGGHLARLREQLASVQTQMLIAMLAGAAAMGAAMATHSQGAGQIGAAAMTAPQTIALRTLLSYQRAQEEQADRAAVRFLNATHQSPKGMYQTFKRLADQMLFAAHSADPYLQSHPMPAQRVNALEQQAKTSPYWNQLDPPALQHRHDMMRAKLIGFMNTPTQVMRHYPPSDTSLPARYARAISSYRYSDIRRAVAQIDGLIAAEPGNPYFYELKGQALLESGHGREAVAPLRHAVQLSHRAPLIEILLGQALLATNSKAAAGEAVNLLRAAMMREPDSADGYSFLAMAYGRTGQLAQADLASAQAALARGDTKTARELAARAKTRFPVGSPGWVKSDDIVTYKPSRPRH